MTADLVARLEAEADHTHSLIAETVGDRRALLAQREALLREAASALRSSGEAFGWYCTRDKRFYRAGEWGNAACEHCTSLYPTPPTSTKA